jgi:excisionase family DNA binding protein
MMQPEYVDRTEAMKILGCSRTTLQTLIKKHKLPVCRLTRRPRYRKADLVNLLESHMSDFKKKASGAAS